MARDFSKLPKETQQEVLRRTIDQTKLSVSTLQNALNQLNDQIEDLQREYKIFTEETE